MLRHLRFLCFVLLAALAGAVAGRVAGEVRRRTEAGEDPMDIDITTISLRPTDLVPGLVAAFRVRDTPWSWLHIPSWLAAFGVNFGVAAVGGDLSRLREMAERAAFGVAGIAFRDSPEAAPVEPIHFDAATDDGNPAPRPTMPPSMEWTPPGPAGYPPRP